MTLSRGFQRIFMSGRAFARAPGLSLGLLLTIALGVGSNTAVYGFLQGLIHPASPVERSDRLVSVFGEDRFRNAGPLSIDEYHLLTNDRRIFEWVGAARIATRRAVIDGRPKTARVAAITPKVAGALRLPLNDGAAISHRLWESVFGASEIVAGSRIRIGEKDLGLRGFSPDHLEGLYSDQSVDIWTPATEQDLEGGGSGTRDLWIIARLGESVSIRQAQAALQSGIAGREVSVAPFTGVAPSMARGLSQVGLFLTFSAGSVFFIACINVASFLLGRALRRSHETCLRVALGASRADLLWGLFADSLVIAGAGGAMGLLLGILTEHALPAFLFEGDAERLSFAPHLLPIVTASLICIVVTVICGMLPVLGTVTDRPWMVLQRETGLPSRATLRLRSALVIGQIAVCCMLVICTAILLTGLRSEMKTVAGHRLGNPILMTVQGQPLGGPEMDAGYFNEVERKAGSIAGLRPLAWTARVPGNEPTWRNFEIQQGSTQYREVAMDISWLTPESLQSLGSSPIIGRGFGIIDQKYQVAVVNKEAAAELFGEETVGVVIRDPDDHPLEIIGVMNGVGIEGPGVQRRSKDGDQKRRPTIYYGVGGSGDSKTIRNARFRVPPVPPLADIELNANVVSSKYFSALDMKLIAGKEFLDHRGSDQGRVAVINREAADAYFGGKALAAGVIDDSGVRTEIIGVVSSPAFGRFEQHAEPTIYFPIWQDCPARMTLMIKGAEWNGGVEAKLKQTVENVPGQGSFPVTIKTLDEQLALSSLAPLRIAALIGGVSAAIGLMLSILGLLSAQGDAERQRQRDRALRIALGAQRWRVVLLVMKNATRLACLGAVIGIFLSFAMVRFLVADVANVVSPSYKVWLIAPLLPVVAVMLASLIPARRASGIATAAIMRDM